MRLKKDGRVRDFVSEGGMGWGGVLKLACVCGLSLRSVPSVSSIPLIRNNHFGLCYEVKSEFFIGLLFLKKSGILFKMVLKVFPQFCPPCCDCNYRPVCCSNNCGG